MKEDLTGIRYGKLIAAEYRGEKKGHDYWLCRCDCGGEKVVERSHLKSGHTKSCGCYRKTFRSDQAQDLTGERYGRLTVLGPARKNGENGYWRCVCDCGAETVSFGEDLRRGSTRSCGCLQEEQRRENMKKAIHFVEGTCVERIACRRNFVNNTSGHRGVYQCGEKRWRAVIGFKGKNYHLGYFPTYEEAVQARLEGEETLYDPFLRRVRLVSDAGR